MTNQRQQILSYIDKYDSISPLEAFRDLGIMRLSARIWEIEHEDGIKLHRKKCKFKTRLGRKGHYTRYSREVQDGKTESI